MIQLAIVGLGYWGPNLLRNFDQLRDCEVLLCCDLNDANLRRIYVQITNDYNALVANPQLDAIVIATSAVTHYDLAKKALLRNKHVFVEKPLTMNFEHAVELVDLASRADRTLMVGHLMEYHPAIGK